MPNSLTPKLFRPPGRQHPLVLGRPRSHSQGHGTSDDILTEPAFLIPPRANSPHPIVHAHKHAKIEYLLQVLGLPNLDRGGLVLPLRSPARSGVSEGDRSLTSVSSSIGTSITQGKGPPKPGPLVSVSPGGSYSDESGRSPSSVTVSFGTDITPVNRSSTQARRKTIPSPGTSDRSAMPHR